MMNKPDKIYTFFLNNDNVAFLDSDEGLNKKTVLSVRCLKD